VIGVDISPKMLEIARAAYPAVAFREGTMLALPAGRGDWAAIVALYAILHLDDAQLRRAFDEFARVLQPGGLLLVAVHVGRERRREERWWGMPAALTGYFHEPQELKELIASAGFTIERTERRPPYPGEYPSERCYVLARRDSPAPVATPTPQG
jgi:SAM-dependent methyltransferase